MNIPLPPNFANRYTDGTPSRPAPQFPPNLAESLPSDTQRKILLWLYTNYVWPQIQERLPFEPSWDRILEMSRIRIPSHELFKNTAQEPDRAKQQSAGSNSDQARVSDSVVHDAIERLVDITAFISFKEGLPVQFAVPDYIRCPYDTPEYRPLQDRIAAGNAVLQWNSANQQLKRQSVILYRHHYTYGLCYVLSDFDFRVEMIARQNNLGQVEPRPEITRIGTTFEPISLRKLWLNWRLPAYNMEAQPCPFMFDETPRFPVMQNVYDPVLNPFGYQNLDKLGRGEMIYSAQEMSAVREALAQTMNLTDSRKNSSAIAQILKPEHSVEAKWLYYPMLPLDPATGEFEKREDGSPVPYRRFVMETFGPNLHSGSQVLLRLQENYYPGNKMPLYSSVHMPDLDSGQYAPSIGELLWNHFVEITLCMEQYLENKDLINNPPVWVASSSPAQNSNFNQKGGKIVVNGPNDFGWRSVPDATSSTTQMIQMLREDAKTTAKVVDAILGKAMGGRTSATEASNAFQSSMSAITTDIDLLTHDVHGGYADRLWDYTGLWFDPDLLEAITGQLGFAMRPEDMWLKIGVRTNVGSTYVEKIVQQQNVRYILEASRNEQMLDRAALWTMLLKNMGFDAAKIVSDGGRDQQIQFATMQTCQVYLGRPTLVDPDQDHQIAILVKTAFLKDQNSVWNTEYRQQAPILIEQIEQHQAFLQMQMQMQLAQQQAQVAAAQLQVQDEQAAALSDKKAAGGSSSNGTQIAATAGQLAQQGPGAR